MRIFDGYNRVVSYYFFIAKIERLLLLEYVFHAFRILNDDIYFSRLNEKSTFNFQARENATAKYECWEKHV